MEEKNSQKQSAEIIEELNFALQKFLLRTSVLEQEQKVLGEKMEELFRMMKLKKVYHYIVTKH